MLAILDAPGFGEILMILLVALLVFGGKLPDVARQVGRGISDLKKGVDGFREEIQKETELEPPPEGPKPAAKKEAPDERAS